MVSECGLKDRFKGADLERFLSEVKTWVREPQPLNPKPPKPKSKDLLHHRTQNSINFFDLTGSRRLRATHGHPELVHAAVTSPLACKAARIIEVGFWHIL